MKILIVDDAPYIIEILKMILSEQDIVNSIETAIDGAEGVSKALVFKPDLIFMDIVMPNLNGIEATKEILIHLPETKVLALSTLTENNIIAEAIGAGCFSFLAKPFEYDDIVNLLSSIDKVQAA